MDLLQSWRAMVLLCLLLPGGRPSPCGVAISPEEPAVELGSSVVLNCTSSCGNYSQLGWEVSVQKMLAQGPGWVSLHIPSVSDWHLDLQCFGVFGKQRDIAVTTLHGYRLPLPQIDLGEEMVAGREARVACNVSSRLLPPGPLDLELTLTLSAGGRTLSTARGRPWLVHGFTARPEQDGQEVTCEALLHLGRRWVNASAAATLRVWAAPYGVNVSATPDPFAAGENLTVTCRVQGNPPPQLRWELPSNASLELRDGNATVAVRGAGRQHSGTYRCLAANRYGAGAARADVGFRGEVPAGSPRSPLVPVAVALAVVVALAAVAGLWYLSHARGWRPMQEGARPG
ncbi:intercellular adhesion molecule 4 isoform X2 [Apteryx mantelli]|uniref:Intercellular adhesion molecule 4 isoform X2 n=1 Tax=Apteryx mantelli TaxID=2696672 RepID=A0ABM4G0Q2_9AVES